MDNNSRITPDFRLALVRWKEATAHLSSVWQNDGAPADVFADSYPSYLPSFDYFACDVDDMDPDRKPKPTLPLLPPIGTVLRARYHLDMGFGPGGNGWPKGWTGEVVDIEPDAQHISIQAHRYLGPDYHQWNNCRVISLDDGMYRYEDEYNRQAADDDQPMEGVLALGLFREFEVVG